MELNNIFENIRSYVMGNLIDESYNFEHISHIPKEKGIYFIIDKNDNNQVIYVGCSEEDKDKEYIQGRFKQYISKNDTGGTFRVNFIKMKYKGIDDFSNYINYIKKNCSIAIISMKDEVNEEIKKTESLMIKIFQPKLNNNKKKL